MKSKINPLKKIFNNPLKPKSKIALTPEMELKRKERLEKKEKNKKKESSFKNLKDKANLAYRYNKFKLYLTLNKKYPKSSEFYNQMFRKFKGENKVRLFWLPGMTWIGPITLALRLKATEVVFRDLEARKIYLKDVVKSEDACLDIIKIGVFNSLKPKSKAYKNYLDKLEAKIISK